jgi:ABC-type multidrug transport system fused ATPase/permease subunit
LRERSGLTALKILVFDESMESADIATNANILIIIGRIFESKIILIPPSLKISEKSRY